MKNKVLISAPPIIPNIHSYEELFKENNIDYFIPPYEVVASLNEEQLIKLLKDVDGILCGDDELNKNVLRACNKLKVISKWGTGIDSIDKNEAKKLGIHVVRVKDAFADPVADTVIGYILVFARNLIQKDKIVRNFQWQKAASYTLKECSLGVIGIGHIGKAVLRRAKAFGMNLYGNDIIDIDAGFIKEVGLNFVSKNELLSLSDFVSINCDLSKTSNNLISSSEFDLMKNNAVIINTARGDIIDEAALIDALQSRVIYGAALDVFENEPLPHDSPLRSIDNVLFSPHNSNTSPEVFKKVDMLSVNNLINSLKEFSN